MTFFRHVPILCRQYLLDLGLESDLPSQHVTLLSVLDDQYQLIDTIDFIFDTLNQRTKGISDIINERIRDPVRSDRDVIFELLDTSPDVLGVGCTSKVELSCQWILTLNDSHVPRVYLL